MFLGVLRVFLDVLRVAKCVFGFLSVFWGF